MKKFSKPRINTFFVEMIIVILFFSIGATIIVQVIAKTNNDICVNKIKSKAIINARTISDMYSINQNIESDLVRVFGDKCTILTDNKGMYRIELNTKLESDDTIKNVILTVTEQITLKDSGTYGELKFVYRYDDDIIYDITSASYINR